MFARSGHLNSRRPAMHRLSVVTICISLCSAFLVACSDREPVRIGMVAGISGRVADLGVAGRNGVTLAVEEQNARGGILGRRIELVVIDDEQKPAKALQALDELLAKKVELIVGPMTSSMAAVMLPRINKASAILLSPTVTSSTLTGIDDNFFRVCGDTGDYGQKVAEFLFRNQNRRTASVIFDSSNREYAEAWLADFRRRFEELGGKIHMIEHFTTSAETGFLEPVRRLLASKPDILMVIANSVDSGLICQQARKTNPVQAIALSEWSATERFIELAGNSAEGAIVSQFFNRESKSPEYLAFLGSYRKRFSSQEPGFAAVGAYDAAKIAIEAISKRNSGESIKQTLLRIGNFNGLQQKISIDAFGDVKRPTFISVVNNGKYRTLGQE